MYLPGAFSEALKFFQGNPEVGLVYAGMQEIDATGQLFKTYTPPHFDLNRLIHSGNYIPQPSTFMKRQAVLDAGLLNPEYHYAMDYDLWIKIGKKYDVLSVPGFWSKFRWHENSKTVSLEKKFWKDVSKISRSHGAKFTSPLFGHHYLAGYPRLLATINRLGRAYFLIKEGHYREFGYKFLKSMRVGRRR